MRPRSIGRIYDATSAAWLVGAVSALSLPAADRLGIWLPLHLALAGAVTVAICGNMQNFAATLTATPAPPLGIVAVQFVVLNAGVGLIAAGRVWDQPFIVASGGTLFIASILLLGFVVRSAWRRGLNRRHGVPMWLYASAIGFLLVGATVGALLGAGAIREGGLYMGLRRAHIALNLLGFASLTVVGTFVTLLPTTLRVRMPAWRGRWTGYALVGGLTICAAGLASRVTWVAVVGIVGYAAGTGGAISLVYLNLKVRRNWPIPASAKHLIAGSAWFAAGSVICVISLVGGPERFDRSIPALEAALVCGWILQVLLGAWLYLLPMRHPGHPDERRRVLAAAELLSNLEIAVLNVGVVLLIVRAQGRASAWVGTAGVWSTLGAGGFVFAKAWASPLLARSDDLVSRHGSVWGLGSGETPSTGAGKLRG